MELNSLSQRTRFMILGPGRSGTTLLKNLLASHTGIMCFAELLLPERIVWGYPEYEKQCNTPNMYRVRQHHPDKFLDSILNNIYKPEILAVGFKALYRQLEEDTPISKPLLSYLQNLSDLKIIHMKRRNLLKVYTSFLMAGIRLNQGKTVTAYNTKDVEHDFRLEINFNDCRNYFEAVERLANKYESLFQHHSHYSVYYEDLAKNSAESTRALLDFLGLEYQQLQTATQKIRQQPVHEVITNYDELKTRFQNSRWTSFFH